MTSDVSHDELSAVTKSEIRALSANIMVHKGSTEVFHGVLPVIDHQFRQWKKGLGFEKDRSATLVLEDMLAHNADDFVITQFKRVYLSR